MITRLSSPQPALKQFLNILICLPMKTAKRAHDGEGRVEHMRLSEFGDGWR